ncbi:hypothetical protein DOTSEDRAFT_66371 [Dothistroma septosporum NZE10]|uniref:Aminoglycoside phosphotransferase domain-containing protein n=1 Tax=Dothistroma septosporum (strain NZE10 / CBS 128990) TaxID=675120 RepID=M2YK71_DOTSN|nr:hypothetical protein DOTSEDRAFT_66371 [Dothistroma septosporum NZE10]
MALSDTPSTFPLDLKPLTRENIVSCLDFAPKIHQPGPNQLVRVRADVVVKYGTLTQLAEAKAMRLVQKHTNLQVPETERRQLVQTIASGLRQLRSICLEVPGPIGCEAKTHGFFFTEYGAGPFNTEEDLSYWLNNRLTVSQQARKIARDSPKFEIKRLALCHMDIDPYNIIVGHNGQPWLVDWGNSGAYPLYFERANLKYTNGHRECGDFFAQLDCLLQVESENLDIQHLHDLHWSLETGALWRRADLDIGDEY